MSRPRVASVSYLNAKPLIEGLEGDVELFLDVPSRLISGLNSGDFDVALLPVADVPGVVTAGGNALPEGGGIACDGPTLTVRLFSDCPLESTRRLWCDTDSHTSVRLARVILRQRYGVVPELLPLPRGQWPTATLLPHDAILLIGDKVITSPPPASLLPRQADLGEEWKRLTGLPFVFAVWTARPGFDASLVARQLAGARDRGLSRVDDIVRRYAPLHGWPHDIARQYLTGLLQYRLSPRHLEAMQRFHAECAAIS
jgi:chorismate dehydratase